MPGNGWDLLFLYELVPYVIFRYVLIIRSYNPFVLWGIVSGQEVQGPGNGQGLYGTIFGGSTVGMGIH